MRVGGDELGREARIFLALHDGDGCAVGADLGLHESETAQPGQIDLARGQRFHHRGVVGHGREHHLHAGLGLEVLAQRRELALQFGRGFVGNRRNPQHVVRGQCRQGGQRRDGQGAGQGLLKRAAA
ncbi:hypothetical protein D3C87_1806320 [compost metagenome]